MREGISGLVVLAGHMHSSNVDAVSRAKVANQSDEITAVRISGGLAAPHVDPGL